VGRGAQTPQSETYTTASPTTIERKWQYVAVYGLGLGMILFPYLISRSRKDYSPPLQSCQYRIDYLSNCADIVPCCIGLGWYQPIIWLLSCLEYTVCLMLGY